MTFADKLKELRARAGLSQAGLARASGLSLSVIHDYEQGNREPSLRSAIRLAAALGTTCEAFATVMKEEAAQPLVASPPKDAAASPPVPPPPARGRSPEPSGEKTAPKKRGRKAKE